MRAPVTMREQPVRLASGGAEVPSKHKDEDCEAASRDRTADEQIHLVEICETRYD